jgi:hypothetical protein
MYRNKYFYSNIIPDIKMMVVQGLINIFKRLNIEYTDHFNNKKRRIEYHVNKNNNDNQDLEKGLLERIKEEQEERIEMNQMPNIRSDYNILKKSNYFLYDSIDFNPILKLFTKNEIPFQKMKSNEYYYVSLPQKIYYLHGTVSQCKIIPLDFDIKVEFPENRFFEKECIFSLSYIKKDNKITITSLEINIYNPVISKRYSEKPFYIKKDDIHLPLNILSGFYIKEGSMGSDLLLIQILNILYQFFHGLK